MKSTSSVFNVESVKLIERYNFIHWFWLNGIIFYKCFACFLSDLLFSDGQIALALRLKELLINVSVVSEWQPEPGSAAGLDWVRV